MVAVNDTKNAHNVLTDAMLCLQYYLYLEKSIVDNDDVIESGRCFCENNVKTTQNNISA